MTWKHDGYTWQSGWFIDEYFAGGNAEDYLMFSADGVTTKGFGSTGRTFASNIGETQPDGTSWDSQARPDRNGDDIAFTFGQKKTRISGLPDHPILGVEALDQVLDSEVEGVEWQNSPFDDTISIKVEPGSTSTSAEAVMISARAGNDIFRIKNDISALLKCKSGAYVNLLGGTGQDYLILNGPLDDWNIQIGQSLEGFEVRPWGMSPCGFIEADEIEIIQGDDFTWTFGDRFSVMGTPAPRNPDETSSFKNNLFSAVPASPSSSGTTVVNNYITNNTSSVSNITNNNTTVNISNSGKGGITVGDIGSVNNATTIDNSFTIQATNINLSLAITGDSKKSEKVEGTDGDDLIADGLGKDKLIGGGGSDKFYFAGEEPFTKKTVDKIMDFDSSEGDAVVVAEDVVGDLQGDPSLAIADTKKDLKQLSKEGHDLLYFEPKCDLYVDGNGDSKGFGKKSEGGIIADLPKDTILTESTLR